MPSMQRSRSCNGWVCCILVRSIYLSIQSCIQISCFQTVIKQVSLITHGASLRSLSTEVAPLMVCLAPFFRMWLLVPPSHQFRRQSRLQQVLLLCLLALYRSCLPPLRRHYPFEASAFSLCARTRSELRVGCEATVPARRVRATGVCFASRRARLPSTQSTSSLSCVKTACTSRKYTVKLIVMSTA